MCKSNGIVLYGKGGCPAAALIYNLNRSLKIHSHGLFTAHSRAAAIWPAITTFPAPIHSQRSFPGTDISRSEWSLDIAGSYIASYEEDKRIRENKCEFMFFG